MAEVTELDEIGRYGAIPNNRFGTNRYPAFISGGVDDDGNLSAPPALTRGSLQAPGTVPTPGTPDDYGLDVPRPGGVLGDIVADPPEIIGDGWGGNPGDAPPDPIGMSLGAHNRWSGIIDGIDKAVPDVAKGILPGGGLLALGIHAGRNHINQKLSNTIKDKESGGGRTATPPSEVTTTSISDGSAGGVRQSRNQDNNHSTGGDGGGYGGNGDSPTGDDTGYGTPFSEGGYVAPGMLKGPNPPGPDDGQASLDIGEYVATAKAVQNYGRDVYDLMNAGIIPQEVIASLVARFGGGQAPQQSALANVRAEGPLTQHPLAAYVAR